MQSRTTRLYVRLIRASLAGMPSPVCHDPEPLTTPQVDELGVSRLAGVRDLVGSAPHRLEGRNQNGIGSHPDT
jgi:hypothetical protein